jgi:hypothetical protein
MRHSPDRNIKLEAVALCIHHTFDNEHTIRRQSCNTSARMTKEESERIHDLCSRIAAEHDQKRFLALVEELNRVLSNKGSVPVQKDPAQRDEER